MHILRNIFLKKLIIIAAILPAAINLSAKLPDYKNPELSVDARVADLLSRMTLEEKVGQLLCPMGWEMFEQKDRKVKVSKHFIDEIKTNHIGMLWATFRADPWTNKDLETGLWPYQAAETANALQDYAVNHTRLGIPLLLAEEAPHGHMALDRRVFPTGYGLGATFDTELMQEIGSVIAQDLRSVGAHISFGPVLDFVRDPRWSRVEESMGEDPTLIGEMGAAMVNGLSGKGLQHPNSTVSTLKHFLGYGLPEAGQNGNYPNIGRRDIMTNLLPPFRQAIDAGALAVMTSYNSIDGIPVTADSTLLNHTLRDLWNFRGIVISDLYSINMLVSSHHTATDLRDAAVQALKAGIDIDLGGLAYKQLIEAVNDGAVSETLIDKAVERVLRIKFELGLFENPYVSPFETTSTTYPENPDLTRRAARESITLLKNSDNLLPLPTNVKVALVGPNADNDYNQLGDYTAYQGPGYVVTTLEGISKSLPDDNVIYAKGCGIRDTTTDLIAEAVNAALQADVVVAVVGGSSARDFRTSYANTGAAEVSDSKVSEMECGEGYDRATLSLMGRQLQLLKALKATGRPLVVVYIEGRPLDKTWAADHADALLTAYYPGERGGDAIADVLFGEYNPAGRVPLTVPRSVGQIPIYYNHKHPARHDYVDESAKPLYAFGYGLSYSDFEYSNLSVNPAPDGNVTVTFTITNKSHLAGDEVPQLYIRDEVASVVQPIMQLKKFTRLHIEPDEEAQVTFTLTPDDFAIINADYQRVVEPGEFTIMIGKSSDNICLSKSITLP